MDNPKIIQTLKQRLHLICKSKAAMCIGISLCTFFLILYLHQHVSDVIPAHILTTNSANPSSFEILCESDVAPSTNPEICPTLYPSNWYSRSYLNPSNSVNPPHTFRFSTVAPRRPNQALSPPLLQYMQSGRSESPPLE